MSENQNNIYEQMPVEDYIKNRLDDQMNWFDKKSAFNQKRYKYFKKAEIGLTISLPVLGFLPLCDYSYNKILLVLVGAIAAYLQAWSHIETYYELWTKYRTACELLKREKYLHQTHTGLYEDTESPESSYHLLVNRVESILAAENSQWNSVIHAIPSNLSHNQGSTNS